jgi:acetolactate synthase-1/2/3 large subunit
MRASLVLTKSLQAAGVDTIFALSGNQIMPIFDACLSTGIRVIHVRHEAAAVFMAEAYARMTGRIGVAMVTAGAGLGNAIAPLFTSGLSQTPVLLLSGDSEVGEDGRGSFQEMDQVTITKAVTKLSKRVTDPQQLSAILGTAMQTATTGMPGPVHLALAADVLTADLLAADIKDTAETSGQCPDADLHGAAPSACLLHAFAAAKRPLILAGPTLGMPHHGDGLRALQDRLGVPVVLMESPRGLNDPRLGSFKSMTKQADLIVCLGKPVDFTLAYGKVGPFDASCEWFVYLGDDTGAEQARKNLGDRLIELGDLGPLAALGMMKHVPTPAGCDVGWCHEVDAAIGYRDFTAVADRSSPGALNSLTLTTAAAQILDKISAVIGISDGGEIGQWVQSVLTKHIKMINGVSGAIGGSLSYGMAAKLANPDSVVMVFMGDGTVGFHLAEFETAVRENLPIIVVIGNDLCWNAEVTIQERDYGPDRAIGCYLSDARYDKVAEALGGHGEYVETLAALEPAFARAIASAKPACINVKIDGFAAPTIVDGSA